MTYCVHKLWDTCTDKQPENIISPAPFRRWCLHKNCHKTRRYEAVFSTISYARHVTDKHRSIFYKHQENAKN